MSSPCATLGGRSPSRWRRRIWRSRRASGSSTLMSAPAMPPGRTRITRTRGSISGPGAGSIRSAPPRRSPPTTRWLKTRAAIVLAQEALGVLLGIDAPADIAGPPDFADAGSLDDILQNIPARRADVRVLDDRVHAAEHIRRDDWTYFSPYASGIAEELYQSPGTPFVPEHTWQLEFLVTVPFYDGGRRYGLAVEHDAELTQARENFAAGLRQARADARIAFEAVARAKAAAASAETASRLAHEALDITNLSYSEGAITNIEVIDAQRRARDADIAREVADDLLAQSEVNLLSAAGLFP